MGSTHAGKHPADRWPTRPLGGYQRAVPRDALTGEPIRPDTVKVHVHDPLGVRDHGAHTQRKRGHASSRLARTPQTRPSLAVSHEPLPVLQLDNLDELDARAAAAADVQSDAQEGDTIADVEGQEVADGE